MMALRPTEKSTALPSGTTSFALTIVYGDTVDATSFQAVLNGQPFAGFSPVAGESETVTLPLLAPGTNVLKLSVRGVRTDGATAKDQDRFTFKVP